MNPETQPQSTVIPESVHPLYWRITLLVADPMPQLKTPLDKETVEGYVRSSNLQGFLELHDVEAFPVLEGVEQDKPSEMHGLPVKFVGLEGPSFGFGLEQLTDEQLLAASHEFLKGPRVPFNPAYQEAITQELGRRLDNKIATGWKGGKP